MEAKEAVALRKEWGEKPCAHPWWVEETVNGADKGKVVCKTCGLDRRKGEPLPDSGKGKTKTKPAKAATVTQKVEEPAVKATAPAQKVEEVDLTASIVNPKIADRAVTAPALNQKVKDLDSAVDGIVALLTADFAFTMQDEAKIASVADKLRDALARGRERQGQKKR